MENKKKKIILSILIILLLVGIGYIVVSNIELGTQDPPINKDPQPVMTVEIIEDTFEAREEPLTPKEVFKLANILGAEITYEPETLDISQPGEYVMKVIITTEDKVIENEAVITVVEKLEIIEEEPVVDDTGCEHEFGSLLNKEGWSNWTVIQEATCIKSGIQQRTRTCKKCGFTETETKAIMATGHTYDNGVVTKEPTCTNSGIKTYTCTKCGSTTQQTLSPLGHNWDNGTITKQPSCTETGTKTFTCQRCGETQTQVIPANGHNWSGWTQTQAPTCTQTGSEKRTCSSCGKVENRTIASLGHNYSSWVVTKEATCTQSGSKERTCNRCGDKIVETINPLGHNWSAWNVTKQPTCTETGTRTRSCNRCGITETETMPALGHNWSNWTVTKQETCCESGSRTRACNRCGEVQTETIAPHPHTPSYSYNLTEDQVVKYRFTCLACQQTFESNDFDTAFTALIIHGNEQKHNGYSVRGYTKPRCTECGQILWDYPARWQ
jgi:hypothetical protein